MWYRQYSEELDLLGNDYGAKIMLHRLLDERDVTDYPVSGLFSLLKKPRERTVRPTYITKGFLPMP